MSKISTHGVTSIIQTKMFMYNEILLNFFEKSNKNRILGNKPVLQSTEGKLYLLQDILLKAMTIAFIREINTNIF